MSSGSLLVLSGPSGVGKTTIARLLAKKPEIARVMTTTTRPRRDDEVDGVDYRFLTKEEFKAAVARGEFLEHAEIGSTPTAPRQRPMLARSRSKKRSNDSTPCAPTNSA